MYFCTAARASQSIFQDTLNNSILWNFFLGYKVPHETGNVCSWLVEYNEVFKYLFCSCFWNCMQAHLDVLILLASVGFAYICSLCPACYGFCWGTGTVLSSSVSICRHLGVVRYFSLSPSYSSYHSASICCSAHPLWAIVSLFAMGSQTRQCWLTPNTGRESGLQLQL